MIERTYRGVAPHPQLTAPPEFGVCEVQAEAIRLATFRQSELTKNGLRAPFPPPLHDNAGEVRQRN